MLRRISALSISTVLLVAACSTDNPVAPSPATTPNVSNLLDGPVRQIAPIEYYRPTQFEAGAEGGGILTRDAAAGVPGAPEAGILYWGGALITQPKIATIYYAPSAIYKNGPKPGTSGVGSADQSLIGFFLRNIGGSPYWNINSTYFQNQGSNTDFVQNSLEYTGFWAANTNAPRAGDVVSPNRMANVVEAGFANGTLKYDPNTLYMIFTGPGVDLGGGFNSDGLSYCAWHSAYLRDNGQIVQFSAMPYDADFNPAHPSANGYICTYLTKGVNRDLGAEATISAMTHETEETATDPVSQWGGKYFYGWTDAFGEENADKCAYRYGATLVRTDIDYWNVLLAGKKFLVQMNWKNGNSLEQGCRVAL